jgi:hypothetical protein
VGLHDLGNLLFEHDPFDISPLRLALKSKACLHGLVLFLFLAEGMEKPKSNPNAAPSAMPKARLSIISPSATPSPTPIASPIPVPSVTSFLDSDRLFVVILASQL